MVVRRTRGVLALVLAVVVGGLVLTAPGTVARGAVPENAGEPGTSVSQQAGTFTYDLGSPWTLLTWFGADSVSVEDALRAQGAAAGGEDVFDVVTAVYAWEASGQRWLGFFPDAIDLPGVNDLDILLNGEAYWVATGGGQGTWLIATPDGGGGPAGVEYEVVYSFCQSDELCEAGFETLVAGETVYFSQTVVPAPLEEVWVEFYWNGEFLTEAVWSPGTAETLYYIEGGVFTPASSGTLEADWYIDGEYYGTVAAEVLAPGGTPNGQLTCTTPVAETADWRLEIEPPTTPGDLFDVVVTALSDEAADAFLYDIEISKPGGGAPAIGAVLIFEAGSTDTLLYPSEFSDAAPPFEGGIYEVDLVVDLFEVEASIEVLCS